MNRQGFTLIEFMIVAALIGILGVLGGSAYFTSMEKGRDAKRIEDIQTIQKGFELYYSRESQYRNCQTDMGTSDIFPSGLPVPTSGSYTYGRPSAAPVSADCGNANQDYCVCAELQNSQYASKFANSGPNCTFTATPKTHYCVRNIQ